MSLLQAGRWSKVGGLGQLSIKNVRCVGCARDGVLRLPWDKLFLEGCCCFHPYRDFRCGGPLIRLS